MGVRRPKRKRQSAARPTRKEIVVAAVGVLVVVLAVGLAQLARFTEGGSSAAMATAVVSKALQDPQVLEVASHFLCPCGTCDRMELSECTCDSPRGGIESKQQIATLLAQGLSVDETVRRLASTFGTLKPDARGTTEGNAPTAAAPVAAARMEAANRLVDPFEVVVARFDCSCGNCRDTLAACVCSHPRGAREMKEFIRSRLGHGDSVDAVVQDTERRYGGVRG